MQPIDHASTMISLILPAKMNDKMNDEKNVVDLR